MINIEKEKEQHKSWYKQDDPIAYQQYRAGGHEFEQDFSQSEKSWLAAKAQAVPEGFALVPKESLKVALFWMNEDIDPWQMGGDSFADLFEHKPILEKAMIEAQERGHE